MNFTTSFKTSTIDDKSNIFTHILISKATELKNALNICVNSICTTPVTNIISSANLFLKKFGMILLRPNSLQLNALNKALNANNENTTVLCS